MKMFRTCLLFSALLFSPLAHAADAVTLEKAWARPAAKGSDGGAYLSITNNTDKAITLTDITSPVTDMAMLHETKMVDGVAQMRMVENLTVPPKSSLAFEPGKKHIMLMELKQPLKAGESFPLTLSFGAVQAKTDVTVQFNAP